MFTTSIAVKRKTIKISSLILLEGGRPMAWGSGEKYDCLL